MRYKIGFFTLLISFVCIFAFPEDLPNLYQPREQIFTSGQPAKTAYSKLQAMGIQTVINVLPSDECEPGEGSVVEANNMIYFSNPFDPMNLEMEKVIQFGRLLKYVEKPVLVHCSTGNHVGGLWFAYRVLIEKAPVTTAIQEGRMIGMQPATEDLVLHWLAEGPASRNFSI